MWTEPVRISIVHNEQAERRRCSQLVKKLDRKLKYETLIKNC